MTVPAEKEVWLETLRRFPQQLTEMVAPLNASELNRVTAVDPWTIAQIVHHCADSHINSFVRLKLALTEDTPLLKGYDQDAWAKMADVIGQPIEPSLQILRGLHVRWVQVFEAVEADEWQRYGLHTESGPMTVTQLLSGYHEHCEAHLAQIARIKAELAQ